MSLDDILNDMKNAIINGDIKKFKEEYNKHGKGFFEIGQGQERRTPFMVACEAKQFEMAKFFLEMGDDINKGIIYYDFNKSSSYIYEESSLFVFLQKRTI